MFKQLDRKMLNRLDFELWFTPIDWQIVGNLIVIDFNVSFENSFKEIEYMSMTLPVDQVLSPLTMNECHSDDRECMIAADVEIYVKKAGNEYCKDLKQRLNIDQLYSPLNFQK